MWLIEGIAVLVFALIVFAAFQIAKPKKVKEVTKELDKLDAEEQGILAEKELSKRKKEIEKLKK